MLSLATAFISIPPAAHGILEFGFFVAVGITAGSLGIL
jgi:hypothetical protein